MVRTETYDSDINDLRSLLKDPGVQKVLTLWKEYNEKKLPIEQEGRRLKAAVIIILILIVGGLTYSQLISTELTAAVFGGITTAIMMGKLNF